MLAATDPAAAIAELELAIERADGRLVVAATALGLGRRQLQRHVWALGAWAVVDAARDRAAARGRMPRGLVRLRRALGAMADRVA